MESLTHTQKKANKRFMGKRGALVIGMELLECLITTDSKGLFLPLYLIVIY